MTTAALAKRVDQLELARQPSTAGLGYACFADDAELQAYHARPGAPRVTAYVQVSPDDWDGDE